jgi:hypothetical protein
MVFYGLGSERFRQTKKINELSRAPPEATVPWIVANS